MKSKHKLYLVAVPIGNLEEITFLGFRILRDTKTIFCEDTRVTRKLLELLDIWRGQDLIKLNQFNEKDSLDLVIRKLEEEDCALVSDAGYPVIADPGYFLVMKLRQQGFNIQVVNGPCAFIHAIVASGIDSRRIFFANFLTKKYLQRKKELENLRVILKEATVVYYESRNFVPRGLEILKEVYGDIKIGVLRELSKLNESWHYDLISNIQQDLIIKGEFVIIIPRQDKDLEECENIDELLEVVHDRVVKDKSKLKEVCREVSTSKFNSRDLYKEYVNRYKN